MRRKLQPLSAEVFDNAVREVLNKELTIASFYGYGVRKSISWHPFCKAWVVRDGEEIFLFAEDEKCDALKKYNGE